MKINSQFAALKPSYLFTEVVARTRAYQEAHPDAHILKMGVGDVRGPMMPSVIAALHAAVEDQATFERFHGYGLENGEQWLRKRIVEVDYLRRGITMTAEEVLVGDGAGSDIGNLSDLFDRCNRVAITDPVYPAYLDTSIMAGREIHFLSATAENGFAPLPNDSDPVYDIIYLCSPGNPTGTALTYEQLQVWVDYANRHDSIILFDGAYEAFVRSKNVPRSIYEIPGARTCAIEIRSFSKTAGFTGIRCGYTIVPKELQREGQSLHQMWMRRQCTKFNGASILSQRAAMAVLTEEGQREAQERIDEYLQNAHLIKQALEKMGIKVYGADNSPYVWFHVPDGYGSWSYFDHLLEHYHIVSTPGVGFGPAGEGYVRLSGFASREVTQEAIRRLSSY